jgi:hypothetical protein
MRKNGFIKVIRACMAGEVAHRPCRFLWRCDAALAGERDGDGGVQNVAGAVIQAGQGSPQNDGLTGEGGQATDFA